MNKKLFTEQGLLSNDGENLLTSFKNELEKVFNKIENISEQEIILMNAALMKMVGDAVWKKKLSLQEKKNEKQRKLDVLFSMQDEDFEAYMDAKYPTKDGRPWVMQTILEEELERCEPISKRRVEKAIEEMKERRKNSLPPYMSVSPYPRGPRYK